MILQPYIGEHQWSHFDGSGRPHSRRTYGTDRSGTKTYRFNSLGFRGEEFRPEAKGHVFACGCSFCFGEGLDEGETAAALFKGLWARGRGLRPDEANLLNFSQGGASNDYVVRTLLTQMKAARPDLVLAFFTHRNRGEYFVGAPADHVRIRSIGPWATEEQLERLDGSNGQVVTEWEEALVYYHMYYSERLGLMNALKNLLLLQSACRSRRVEYLITWVDRELLDDPSYASDPLFVPWFGCIDRSRLCELSIIDRDVFVDVAADGAHPGPRSNALLAEGLFRSYERLAGRSAFAGGEAHG